MSLPPPEPEQAPTLPDELLEEVFLRFPPDEPAWLVRASLASKLWLGLLTGPSFHGRYRELHGDPPMLGFFYCRPWPPYSKPLEKETEPLFISTTKFQARISSEVQGWRPRGCNALDCRHGRVVLGNKAGVPAGKLTVSDPMKGSLWDMWAPADVDSFGAAVVCAVKGCDHRACHDGPFWVIFVGMEFRDDTVGSVWLSSPETGDCSKLSSDIHLGEWGEVCSLFHIEGYPLIEPTCPVLVENALHFMLEYSDDDYGHIGILKYDLSSNCLSLIDAPLDVAATSGATILMAMEDASLGFAYMGELTLYLWSRQRGSDGEVSWTERKVINLGELLSILYPENKPTLIGSVEGRDIIFVNTDDLGICEINLKTLQWKKIWKKEKVDTLVPYMSFEVQKNCDVTH